MVGKAKLLTRLLFAPFVPQGWYCQSNSSCFFLVNQRARRQSLFDLYYNVSCVLISAAASGEEITIKDI